MPHRVSGLTFAGNTRSDTGFRIQEVIPSGNHSDWFI